MAFDSDDTNRRNRNRSWWQQRTNMERNSIILLTIAIILIVILIISLAVVAHKSKQSNTDICTTPGCVQAAARILSNIDESVDPCSNFYEFACGRFLREKTIPDDKAEINPFSDLADEVNIQLRELFEEPSSSNEPRPFTMLKNLYRSCVDTDTVEKENLKVMKNLLKELGGWPMLEGKNWNEQSFDWQKFVYKFRKHGLSTDNFFTITIEPDLKNSTQPIINLDQPTMEITREYMLQGLDNDIVSAYYKYVLNVALEFGASKPYVEYDLKNMLEFRKKIAEFSIPEEERRERIALYHPMTIKELQQKYPSIYWLEFINNIIASPDHNLTVNDYVSVSVPKYFSALGDLLQTTAKRAQANHAIIQAIRSLELHLPESIRKLGQRFETALYGTTQTPKRWEQCVSSVSSRMDIAASALYVRKHFSEETKQAAILMVTDIKNEFIEILKKTEWMDDTTKKLAIEKAIGIQPHVGYADELLDDNKLEEYYSKLSIDSENSLYNFLNASVFDKNIEMEWLSKQFNKSDWKTRIRSTIINAGYAGYENSIQIPAAILQNVMFDEDRLKALNYGGLGYFIGHEITHGFDNEGKTLNKDGNYEKWWAEETHKAFLNKAQCIINQYSNYTVTEVGKKINGIITQGENIADNGGIKEAYLAYISWIKRNGEEPKLPGLNYNPKQLFWISAANCWCSLERPESLIIDLDGDEHSPAEYRIIGPLSNSEYFASDFRCPVSSKMNPKHKCQVW